MNVVSILALITQFLDVIAFLGFTVEIEEYDGLELLKIGFFGLFASLLVRCLLQICILLFIGFDFIFIAVSQLILLLDSFITPSIFLGRHSVDSLVFYLG